MLVPSIPIVPVVGLLAVGRFVLRAVGPKAAIGAWPARAVLLAVFALAVSDLASDVSTLA